MAEEYNERAGADNNSSETSTRSPEYVRSGGKDRPPIFSRVFVLGDKRSTEKDYMETFSKYGKVNGVRLVLEKHTREPNGIAYLTMSKTSEAALCVENLTGEVMPGAVRSLKVLFASERMADGSTQSDAEINEQVCRLFLFVPKTLNESQLRDIFSKYGTITNLTILQDKATRESKGLAFITYDKASSAAKAYEECDESYRPKFADPASRKRGREDDDHGRSYNRDRDQRDPRDRNPRDRDSRVGDRFSSRDRDRDYVVRERAREREFSYRERERERDRYSRDAPSSTVVLPITGGQRSAAGVLDYLSTYPNNGVTTLLVKVPKGLNNAQVTKLFNLVPTLDSCELVSNSYSVKDEARITYSSPACAAYAHEVFSGFEYPPGCQLEVEFSQQPMVVDVGVYNGSESRSGSTAVNNYDQYMTPNTGLTRSGYTDVSAPSSDNSWINLLPPPQALVDHTTECLKRLFFVCTPSRIDNSTLENLFCRFGFLIHVNYLPGKACGFAKFANAVCATIAMETLNQKSLDGISLKVMEAQAPPEKVAKQE